MVMKQSMNLPSTSPPTMLAFTQSSPHFGELRSILQEPPSPQSWAKLCLVIERFGPGELERVALPYACAHLTRWPITMRALPHRWLVLLLSGRSVPWMPLVRHLDMSSSALLHDVACAALMRQPALEYLDSLCIKSVERVSFRGVQLLLSSPHLHNLGALKLSGLGLYDQTLEAILSQLRAVALRRLDLSQNSLTLRGLEGLLHTPGLQKLSALNLSDNPLGDIGAKLLGRAKVWAELSELSLDRIGLSEQGARALAGAPWLPQLKHLSLRQNPIYHVGAHAIFSCKAMTSLESLDLSGCRVGLQGVRSLVRSAPPHQLKALGLAGEPGFSLGPRGAGLLSEAEGLSSLSSIDLAWNDVGDQGLDKLIRAPWIKGVGKLVLSHNRLHDSSLMRLERALDQLPQLRELDVRANAFTANAKTTMKALSPRYPALRLLDDA